MRGDLGQRLPLSGRRDELDLLASIVNSMLAELEHSMSEVKGVCDNIAHDLRTPLTRLRAQLYRLQQHAPTGDTAARRSEEHTSELQSLMRISYAVFCLKKKKTTINTHHSSTHYITQQPHN